MERKITHLAFSLHEANIMLCGQFSTAVQNKYTNVKALCPNNKKKGHTF